MANNSPPPRWAALIIIVLSLCCGLYIVLVSLGIVAEVPSTKRSKFQFLDGPLHWQSISMGVAFISGGVALAFSNTVNWLTKINLIVLVPSLIAPLISIVYFHIDSLLMQVWLSFIIFFAVIITVDYYLFPSRRHSKKPPVIARAKDPVEDPLHDAEVHLSWGRTEQAEAILEKAMQHYPSRAAEFQRKLLKIRQDT